MSHIHVPLVNKGISFAYKDSFKFCGELGEKKKKNNLLTNEENQQQMQQACDDKSQNQT